MAKTPVPDIRPRERVADEAMYQTPPQASNDNRRVGRRYVPPQADNDNQRIDGVTKWVMLSLAFLFDLAQLASKIFILTGLTLLGAVAGAEIGDIIGLPGLGASIGALAGGVLTFLGIGAIVGIVMSEISSWFFAIIGWSIMYLWFHIRGVPILEGKNLEKRATVAIVAILVDFIPFLNLLPGITIWTYVMITLTQAEDKLTKEAKQVGYNKLNTNRMERRYVTNNNREEQDIADAA